MTDRTNSEIIHGTPVCVEDRAALIIGPSGSGKSALALQLLALGARLVSDDRTVLTRTGTTLIAEAPSQIKGMIEARGVGILRVEPAHRGTVAFIVDLATTETVRLPDPRTRELLGIPIPCLHHVESPHFAASILLCLQGGLAERL